MDVKVKFELSKWQFGQLYSNHPEDYRAGFVRFGGLVGVLIHHPDGKPTMEIYDGFDVLPYTIDVPVCENLQTFKKKVRERIVELVRGDMHDMYAVSYKRAKMIECTSRIAEIVRNVTGDHLLLYYTKCSHDEYIEVCDSSMALIDKVDVAGLDVMESMAKLMEYLSEFYREEE